MRVVGKKVEGFRFEEIQPNCCIPLMASYVGFKLSVAWRREERRR